MKNQTARRKVIQVLSTLVVSSVLTISFAAGEYFGFDSYQAYVNNYYSQQAALIRNAELPTLPTTPASQVAPTVKTIKPITVFTPAPTNQVQANQAQLIQAQRIATTPVPVAAVPTAITTNSYYNGFSSYQDYLNNYYATIGNPRSIAPADLTPMQTQSCLTVNDILKTDVEGQFLACDGTLYTVTRNEELIAGGPNNAPRFLLNYSISYQEVSEAEGTVYTPVYVYPELEPRTQVQDPVPAVKFNTVQALNFQVGNSYTFDNGLKLTVLEINDNRCFAGQYCAQAGEVVARFTVEFRNERNLLTVTMEPGQEPEINFLLANTAIKFTGVSYEQGNNQPALKSVVQTR